MLAWLAAVQKIRYDHDAQHEFHARLLLLSRVWGVRINGS